MEYADGLEGAVGGGRQHSHARLQTWDAAALQGPWHGSPSPSLLCYAFDGTGEGAREPGWGLACLGPEWRLSDPVSGDTEEQNL